MLPSIEEIHQQGLRLDEWLEREYLIRVFLKNLKEKYPEYCSEMEKKFKEKMDKSNSSPEQK